MKTNFKNVAIITAVLATVGSVDAFAQGRPSTNRNTRPSTASRNTGRPTAGRPQATRPAPGSRPVAVVDISFIFNNYAGFKNRMDNMKKAVQAYEGQLKQRHEALGKDREQLSQFKPGSSDYKRKEQELAGKFSNLQVETQLKKKEFLEDEAKVYYETYGLVENVIKNYASRNGIGLVLRFSKERMNENDRNSVLAGVNRAVVFHQGSLDITNDILSELSRVPAGGNRAAQRPRTRPSRQ